MSTDEMDNNPSDATTGEDPRVEALQAVFDRVSSYNESAPDGTVRAELDKALGEAGLALDDDVRERIVEHIDGGAEQVDVETFLR